MRTGRLLTHGPTIDSMPRDLGRTTGERRAEHDVVAVGVVREQQRPRGVHRHGRRDLACARKLAQRRGRLRVDDERRLAEMRVRVRRRCRRGQGAAASARNAAQALAPEMFRRRRRGARAIRRSRGTESRLRSRARHRPRTRRTRARCRGTRPARTIRRCTGDACSRPDATCVAPVRSTQTRISGGLRKIEAGGGVRAQQVLDARGLLRRRRCRASLPRATAAARS